MFDVVVIGAGHAGCEAAAASARSGARTALLSFQPQDAGQMSCNPSIGGVGKGHLVRELDVFDGLMARAADAAAIHRRMLNRSKGPAVWGPRVQADRALYRQAIEKLLADQAIERITGEAIALTIDADAVTGVQLADGTALSARAVVIATGTFLDARIFIGEESSAAGRAGERASLRLAQQVRELGLAARRLKTGTPPRLDGRTIDWAGLEEQPSDREVWAFSAHPDRLPGAPQLRCAITRTTSRTHDIIRAAEGRSPLYSGVIEGRGPRYCPSIEDKVRRFGDRDGHQIFLEPEGLGDPLVYPNGISTSMPRDVQQAFVRSIPGLERAEIVRLGYAVEYEHVDPRRLGSDLQTRALAGLFLAGQINGTTGYEEAAAQGLVAGLNAARFAGGTAPILFDRASSYIGVMIDDLTLQGVTEPYRMMTARAEFRLHLRADNAVTRLGEDALASGALSRARADAIGKHLEARSDPSFASTEEGEADAMYAPYIDRQRREWSAVERSRAVRIPHNFDFRSLAGLSAEMAERLETARPETLDQASRIPGITPAALTALYVGTARAAA
ncbi:tRNA uridine-5-carboxymethylaminomethyl(34) synthesis enzyme MnmG [Sphingomonas glaciei]|uniref:tRNA uridine 5-carboxymethylaminomethyl modification enzyme MnmG n=1 Tax=Sphingomonas glaciei TaxID=2938948 RepID=A0ABY5MS24_9SPHN|nr:tRNA uridine-5-carboxymethylaminomethyl(34) synthesis enzyme MnmG [Sphingomonas glaciei]UUR07300.1 tRNA uridine-5-carboxymethylaminomethyl(34) synthesis enzyme MnmG [Sphingomonas glaciei]